MSSTRRRTRRSWPAALAIATAANLALLSLLAFQDGDRLQLDADASRPVDVTLAPWPILRAASKAPPRRSASAAHAATASQTSPKPPAIAPPVLSAQPPAGEPPGAASPSAELKSALRRGLVGCAHQDASWMTDADRAACRQYLAASAANVPHLQGMAPAKLAYYDALAKAQQDWLSGREPGNLPFLYCGLRFGQGRARSVIGPPHALKLGPCFLEPPRGSLIATVDVPSPDDPPPDPLGLVAGQNPIRHQGQ